MTKAVWLLASAALIVAGVALFALQPGPPEPVCATDPHQASGFADPQQNCPISIDSFNQIREDETSPKWFRIAGVLTGLAGVILAIVVGIARIRSPGRPQP